MFPLPVCLKPNNHYPIYHNDHLNPKFSPRRRWRLHPSLFADKINVDPVCLAHTQSHSSENYIHQPSTCIQSENRISPLSLPPRLVKTPSYVLDYWPDWLIPFQTCSTALSPQICFGTATYLKNQVRRFYSTVQNLSAFSLFLSK